MLPHTDTAYCQRHTARVPARWWADGWFVRPAQTTRKAGGKTLRPAARGGRCFLYIMVAHHFFFPGGCTPITSPYPGPAQGAPRAYVVVPTPEARNRQVSCL